MREMNSNLNQILLPVLLLVLAVAWLLSFQSSLVTVFPIWYGNEIYNHCFLIVPGALYLIYRDRHRFNAAVIAPNFWVLLPLLLVLLLGLIAYIGQINVLMHFSTFASIGLIAWLCLGNAKTKIIWYPLLFLLFAIPVGEEFVPYLQEFAADVAEYLLRLVDIPIYRSGLYIEIPVGKFVVAEACSGIKFLTSTLAFGAFYAQITYVHFSRKVLFMLLAFVLPIIANALRVFGTILIGHFYGMESASGFDHLLFGWLLFAVVLLLLIFIGNLFSESKVELNSADLIKPVITSNHHNKLRIALVAVSILLIGKYVWSIASVAPSQEKYKGLNVGAFAEQAVKLRHVDGWLPIFEDADEFELLQFRQASIELFVAWYSGQDTEAELVASGNRIFHPTEWTLVKSKEQPLKLAEQVLNTRVVEITSSHGDTRYVLYWYQVGNYGTANTIQVKLLQIADQLQGGAGAGAVIAYSVSGDNLDIEQAASVMSRFIEAQFDELQHYLPKANAQ